MNKEKTQIRTWAKELRSTLDLIKASNEIESRIKKLDIYKSSKNVMSYHSKDIEVSLNNLFQDNLKQWFLPAVKETGTSSGGPKLIVLPFNPQKTKLIKNQFNILEPEITGNDYFDQIERKIKLDLIFVPGLCFDKRGNRIGFGMGYYDSFLKLNPGTLKIGICPKECLLDELPVNDWDIGVDMVVTD